MLVHWIILRLTYNSYCSCRGHHHLVRQGIVKLLESTTDLQVVGEADDGLQAVALAEIAASRCYGARYFRCQNMMDFKPWPRL